MKTEELLEKIYIECLDGKLENNGLRHHKRAIGTLAQQALLKWSPSKKADLFDDSIFQVLDFFCGCGGMSLGFAALSRLHPFFNLVGGCDIDPDAITTYKRNFNTAGICEDIRSLTDNEVNLAKFKDGLNKYDENKPLIVIGCAPCQGFTSHRKKHWSKDDHRNTLIGAFASIAVRLHPICIVMENVPEMLSKKYWEHFEEARDILHAAGYVVHQTIYNAASFGVPQERFRSVVIAMKKDFLLPDPIIDSKDFSTVRKAIGKLPPISPGEQHPKDKYHRSAYHRPSTIETIRAVPENGGSRPTGVGPKCLDRVKGFYDVYGRLYWDRPAITITHYARNPASGRYVHPDQHRGLTMREAALLQSFPIGFEFEGTFDSVFKQIGEAVPPMMACAIAASVLVELLSPPPTKEEIEQSIQSIMQPVSNSFSSVIAGLKSTRRKQ
jgi:DNA (cytosine-5)-methyltransferase 1